MAVGPYNQVTWNDKTLFRQDHVLNTPVPQLDVVLYSLFERKVSHDFGLLGRGNILIGHKMVRDKCDLFSVKHPINPQLLKYPNGKRCRDIVCQGQIHLHLYQIPGAY